ncbi:hypothetical protein KEM55_000728, partial [Ascosphaera atra]
NESMESMFERTLTSMVKRQNQQQQAQAVPPPIIDAMEIDGDPHAQMPPPKPPKPEKPELGPIVNCDRGYWRKVDTRRTNKAAHVNPGPVKVEP